MGPAPQGSALKRGLVTLAGAGVAAITLMACYGMPPCEAPPPQGSSDPYHCYNVHPDTADGGDAGPQPTDGGTGGTP